MRIGIAGLGNVGAAVMQLLQSNGDLLSVRTGKKFEITAVSARDKNKARNCMLGDIDWETDPSILAARADVDVVVEVIGGAEGIAHKTVETALKNGKHVVTANKALIAVHGVVLAQIAEKVGLQLSFEAAVCGAVPVLKTLREGLAANRISSLRGILNGTCNYILSRMEQGGVDFAAALAEAQQKGYAETNPRNDIDGIDSANKLAIMVAVAFGRAPDLDSIFVEGIAALTPNDLRDARMRGGCIKLLGTADLTPQGELIQRVQPVFVPHNEALARVSGVLNAVEITGDFAGKIIVQGQGAGGTATASAIVADLVDIARGHRDCAFGVAASAL